MILLVFVFFIQVRFVTEDIDRATVSSILTQLCTLTVSLSTVMARGLALVAVAALVARCSDAVAGAQRALARSLSRARALYLTQHGPSPTLGGFDCFGARATVPKGEHSPFMTQCPIPSPLSSHRPHLWL